MSSFNSFYNSTSTSPWVGAPSNPTAATLFSNPITYSRPANGYIALRAILGKDNWVSANKEIQTTYHGTFITQPQQIAVYKKWLPNKSQGCMDKLDAFFKQWWDTAYVGSPAAGNKPAITGPGLAGGGFYDAAGNCSDYGYAPVTGTVPATLSLTLGGPATFSAFTPGVAKDYSASTTATVISTAGDATLSVADPSSVATGHLVNGTFSLPSALGGLGVIKTWAAPTSNESVPVTFTQHIGATDALRTGTYSKTLTFTLSTTTP